MVRRHYFMIDDEQWNKLVNSQRLVGSLELYLTANYNRMPVFKAFGPARRKPKARAMVKTIRRMVSVTLTKEWRSKR